jgi:hypothetical protein
LEARETHLEETRAHRRQAILALLFGGGAWGFALAGGLLSALGAQQGVDGGAYVGLAFLFLFPSPIFALLGIGQGAAAVRRRGDQLILATIGFLLSGLFLGGVMGVLIATLRYGARAGA